MDTHSIAHTLILSSLPLALAGGTTAAWMLLKHQQRLEAAQARQRTVKALRRQATYAAQPARNDPGAYSRQRVQVIRQPLEFEQRPCLGHIAPEHAVWDAAMPGHQSGPPEDN